MFIFALQKVYKAQINNKKDIKKMKKAYLKPEVQAFVMRAERIIATSIPKTDEEIDDDSKDNYDFAPKDNGDWNN